MKYTSAVLALAAGASAHTLMSEIYIDGAGQGSGTCVRTPHNAKGAVDPIIDLSSKDMACGQDGEYGVARTCPMSGGQQLTFEYRQWPDDAPRASIAMGHMGPCAVYLKKVDDATKAGASGDGWFKLWDEGLDGSGQWCTNKRVTESNGHLSVTIPDSLPGGDYLVRPELLALHNIPEKHQPEFYIGCAQVFLKSSGNSGPKSTVSIPGYVDGSEPGLTYNPFNKPLKDYEVPGPKVYTPSSGGVSVMKNMKQSDGLGEGCLVTNNNWCGKELPSYTDEDGCWDADKNCWDQLDKCYDEAGAVGLVGCKTWEKYCKDNQSNCKSGNSGPPSAQNLDSDHKTIETPASANGGMDYGSSGSSSGSDDSSSNNEQSSSSNSADDYKKKEVKAPSYDNSNNNDNSQEESAPAPQQTSAPEQYKPSSQKAEAPATTLVTKAKTQDNVVYETVYETVNAYATVTDVAYATETVQAYRRHAHPRHAAAH